MSYKIYKVINEIPIQVSPGYWSFSEEIHKDGVFILEYNAQKCIRIAYRVDFIEYWSLIKWVDKHLWINYSNTLSKKEILDIQEKASKYFKLINP